MAGKSTLNRKVGSNAVISIEFRVLSSIIMEQCAFLQNLIQQVIFTSHGPDLDDAKKAVKDFPNPKARIDFLCSLNYVLDDVVAEKVFEYARGLFKDIYDIRNILAHEVWSSSEEYAGSVLFSSLDEDARLLMASGRLWHKEEATPQEIYDATIRYISKIKIMNCDHLRAVINSMEICNWSLMNITSLLGEKDDDRKEAARKLFLTFGGTSHLFDVVSPPEETAEFSSSKEKTIYGQDGV